ncbi:MAG: hypothetical protein WEF53_10095 [Bacteroidota bacterium]
MRTLRFTVLICFGLLAAGCPARSISPLFSEKDIAFDPLLVGSWSQTGDEPLIFENSGDNTYRVTLQEKDQKTTYTAHLGKLRNAWFIESFADNSGNDYHLLPAFIVHRIWLEGDSLKLAALRSDWLREMIDARKISIPHIRRDSEIILTASTEELQKFVARYADVAFLDRETFFRVK